MDVKDRYRCPIDWEIITLGDLFAFKNGLNKRKEYFGYGTPIVNYMDVYKRSGIRAADLNGRVNLSKQEIKAYEVRKGDVFFTRTSETTDEIGIASVMLDDPQDTVFSGFLLRARPRNECLDDQFKKYCFSTNEVRKAIISKSSYTTRALTNGRLLSSVTIPLPSIHEQRAIAAALSDVDALIAALDRLIAKKRDIKQAAMQELLTGKKRLPGFSGKLSSVCLGELGSFSKGRGIKKDDVAASGIPCVRYGEIYTHYNDYIREFHSFISEEIAKESQQIRNGDLLFAGSGETAEEIGKCVAYLKDEEACAGGDIVIFSPEKQNSMYLGYLMNHSSIVIQKARMGQGDAVVHISAKNLAGLRLKLPPINEQNAIASILSDMDAEIAALETRHQKTLALKQGMMQELLTGRIRLIKGAEA
ncbi:MAG: hypothetical protein GXY18_15395 [Methanomicrobiales archaeon]|nr:hypothetical protein [Methanomicrobiales archaeon]